MVPLLSSLGLVLRTLSGSQYMTSLQKLILHNMEALANFTALTVMR